VANSIIFVAATARPLVPAAQSGLDILPGSREAMKQQQPRETAPLWVWLFFGLLVIGAATYLTGYWMFEELIAHFKK
jgi:hypothetical protein